MTQVPKWHSVPETLTTPMASAAAAAKAAGGDFAAQYQAAVTAAPHVLSFLDAMRLVRGCANAVADASPEVQKAVGTVVETMHNAIIETMGVMVQPEGQHPAPELACCPWCDQTPELSLRTYDTASRKTYGITCCVEMETDTTDREKAIAMWNDRCASPTSYILNPA